MGNVLSPTCNENDQHALNINIQHLFYLWSLEAIMDAHTYTVMNIST